MGWLFERNPRPDGSAQIPHFTILIVLAVGSAASAQTDFARLKSFGNPLLSAATPWSTPIEGSDGTLYGTTYEGGGSDFGTVFRVNKDGSGLTILHSFVGAPADGKQPQGGLVEGADGQLYGTTYSGGLSNLGTIFRLNKDGSGFAIIKFIATSAEGAGPQGPLCFGSDGLLYGTSSTTAFKLNPDGSGFAVLHTFGTSPDGSGPQFGVQEASDGLLYGATVAGGSNNLGTIFKMSKGGSNYAVLFNFAGTNGRSPQAPVVEASDGMLYGTTSYRRTNSYGTLFQLSKDGSSFVTIHDFSGATDGWYPQSALIEGDDGALYGTCTNGGIAGQGLVFKLNKDGSGYAHLHDCLWGNADARVPLAGLLKASDAKLYGLSERGGQADYGGLFRLDQDGSNYVVLASFSWTGGDGWSPRANLFEASDGFLYDTTFNGGSNDFGTVFRMNKDLSGYSVLHHFDRPTEGACPAGGLIQGTNGALFGTALDGGTNGFGTVFTLRTDSSGFSVLHHFSGLNGDGSHPQSGLILGSDGRLYGTTSEGGSNDWGTVFGLNEDGSVFTVLRDFPGTNITEITPVARLFEGSDGMLYGTTSATTNAAGTIFRLAKDGSAYTNIYIFTNAAYLGPGLIGGLIEGPDSALYGTGASGGNYNQGLVYKINKDGSGFTNLHSFGAPLDGKNPIAALTRGSPLSYGTTFDGSRLDFGSFRYWGVVFSMMPDGSQYQVLFNFTYVSAGQNPSASLIMASDGGLYGTTLAGGDMGAGSIFSLANPPAFVSIQPAPAGMLLQFTGAVSRTYSVQASTSLNPVSWQQLPGPVILSNGVFQCLDNNSAAITGKFYRSVMSHGRP